MTRTVEDRRSVIPAIATLTIAIAAVGVGIGIALGSSSSRLVDGAPFALVFLVLLLIAAEYLLVSFRHRGEVDTWNLMEAALAPMLFAFAGPTAMLAVAVAQLVSGMLRRNTPLKLSFNVAQWVLATAIGSVVVERFGSGHDVPGVLLVIGAALAGVALVNQLAMTAVLSIVGATSPVQVLRRRGVELMPGALIGWSANVLLGLLFVFALHAHAAAVVLFPVPLVALHLAYRTAAGARIERVRQAGIQDAIRTLALPMDPADSVAAFVDAVRVTFDAGVVCVAIVPPGGDPLTHSNSADDAVQALTRAVLERGESGRFDSGDGTPIGSALAAGGWRSCICDVCRDGQAEVAIVVVDQDGPDIDASREVALLTGLTREALRIMEKGRLVRELDDERRSLGAIVSATSDGIATIDTDGVVRSWNPAFERLAGFGAGQIIGSRSVFARLQARTLGGTRVDIDRWATGGRLPRELRITAAHGEPRRLTCAYSRAVDEPSGASVLVVVARDITATEEMDALRAQFTRLVEAAPRSTPWPTSWPQQLVPLTPVIRTEVAVDHGVDARSRSGVDPYDWYVLPDGDVHFATISLLARDASRWKQAIGAIEELRALADDDAVFDDIATMADTLFGTERGVAATAVVGRYNPGDGSVEIAGVGGATVMIVTPHDGVHELTMGRRGVIDLRLALGESIVVTTTPSPSGRAARRNLVDRLDRLAHVPAADLVADLVAASGALVRPASLVLALRRTGSEPTRSWRVPPSVEAVGMFRREIVRWLRDHAVPRERLDEIAVIVSELLTNAVAAARTSVEVHALIDVPILELAVSDDGQGFEVALDEIPDVEDVLAESGRGLHIVDALASTWTVRAGADGATVRAQVRVGGEGPDSVPIDAVHPAALDARRGQHRALT